MSIYTSILINYIETTNLFLNIIWQIFIYPIHFCNTFINVFISWPYFILSHRIPIYPFNHLLPINYFLFEFVDTSDPTYVRLMCYDPWYILPFAIAAVEVCIFTILIPSYILTVTNFLFFWIIIIQILIGTIIYKLFGYRIPTYRYFLFFLQKVIEEEPIRFYNRWKYKLFDYYRNIMLNMYRMRFTSWRFITTLIIFVTTVYSIFYFYEILYESKVVKDVDTIITKHVLAEINADRIGRARVKIVDPLKYLDYKGRGFICILIGNIFASIWWFLILVSPRFINFLQNNKEMALMITFGLLTTPVITTGWLIDVWLTYHEMSPDWEYFMIFSEWVLLLAGHCIGEAAEQIEEEKWELEWELDDENPIWEMRINESAGLEELRGGYEELRGDLTSRLDQKAERIYTYFLRYEWMLYSLQHDKLDSFRYYLFGIYYYYVWKRPYLLIKFSIQYYKKKIQFLWWRFKNT